MPSINYDTRQKIIDQALKEIAWARTYKQGKTRHWQLNERMYYGLKDKDDTSRANVDLGKMQEFIHAFLSKIDGQLIFKFVKRKNSQLKAVDRLNALRADDQDDDDWDMKDLAGKKQALIYGRTVYWYFADSINGGYQPHLENVDVYNFLIDPSAGGLDVEQAWYLGRYGIVKSRDELVSGMKGRNSLYLKTETQRLLDGSGNATETTQETQNTLQRTRDTDVWQTQKQIDNPDKFVFWEWCTTYQGERYYLLLNEKGATAIRIEPLADIFESNLWPCWTWAPYPDQTEFWTPAPADYAREIFMAQAVTVNQMLDNAEQRNKPQRVISVVAVKNVQQLKYQRGGNYVEVDLTAGGMNDVRQAVSNLEVPEINTPIEVYNILEAIQEKASGVTAAAKGEAEPDGKATIYEGNQAAAADRFGLINRAYAHGYKRFARLYKAGVKEHLTKKRAVEIMGPEGVNIEMVSKRDIFRKGDEDFRVSVESSAAETEQSELEKRTKIQFLQQQMVMPTTAQNPKKAYEVAASIAGFDDDTIRQLLDTSEFGDAELMSEADRDIEDILEGEKVLPNPGASAAYMQRFVDYLADNQNELDPDQAQRLYRYMDALPDIILRNLQRRLIEQRLTQAISSPQMPPAPGMPPATGAPAPILPDAPQPGMAINGITPPGA